MRIKYVRLNNIRSYTDETINMTGGNTLLSGTIGCGKSTVLLAIDFAFFGVQKGLSGSDILRHGAARGYVEVCIEANGKDITIRRRLKRSNDTIVQEAGTILQDGVENEYTATELKAKVLELFGYPQDSSKKNRPIFKYTVYTPQEQLKHILLQEEERLQTLRQIFGVDKYGIIRDNSKILLSEMRSLARELNAIMLGMEDLENLISDLNNEKRNSQEMLSAESASLDKINIMLKEKTYALKEHRALQQRTQRLYEEYARLEAGLSAKRHRLGQIEDETARISIVSVPEMNENEEEIIKLISDAEHRRTKILSENAVAAKDIERLSKMIKEGVCNMCGQSIDSNSFSASLHEKEHLLESCAGSIKKISNDLVSLRSAYTEAQRCKILLRQAEEQKARLKRMKDEKSMLENDIILMKQNMDEIEPSISNYSHAENNISEMENTIQKVNEEKLFAERNISGLKEKIRGCEQQNSAAHAELIKKYNARERLAKVSSVSNWLENTFVPMLATMEKHVMYAIQRQFDDYFQHWFSMLMDESLGVRIDENFSPHIEQNGYETEFNNLSGGEKTSVALAYRLALNMVINRMIDTIQTKDILILDEPTDGFSSDQLDRLRNVLNELNLGQVIIVSHEQKMDAYVDNIIKVYKENHVSKVMA
ncbi:MAG TPA: AAA family ATPase [archaeon]|nr:AAA family ATPase [archaeon]